MKKNKRKVLMYHTNEGMVGGPTTYINNIISSSLAEQYDFEVYYQNCAPNGLNLKLLKRIVKDFKRINPDIVHVHGLQSEGFYGVLAAKIARRKKIVTTIHGFAFDNIYASKIKRILYRYMVEPITLRLSTDVYCVCEYADKRKIVQRNVKKKKSNYIYNPVPQNMKILESRENLRAKLSYTESDVVFAISGRVVRDKGFDLLGRIVKDVHHKGYINFKLLIIGDGEYRNVFEQEMKEEIKLGQVIITGQTNRVADYLNAADVFIFPSYHENLPISLLEAGMSGLPCIVSSVGGIPEIVKDKETGYVIKNFEIAEYTNSIINLMCNKKLRKEMSINIKEDIAKRFSMELFCERLDEIYRQ